MHSDRRGGCRSRPKKCLLEAHPAPFWERIFISYRSRSNLNGRRPSLSIDAEPALPGCPAPLGDSVAPSSDGPYLGGRIGGGDGTGDGDGARDGDRRVHRRAQPANWRPESGFSSRQYDPEYHGTTRTRNSKVSAADEALPRDAPGIQSRLASRQGGSSFSATSAVLYRAPRSVMI